MNAPLLDCLVIGGGPAGLVASVYLARYRRTLRLVDAGESRLQWIPKTRNVLGFPDGITGTALLERLREHAHRYGVEPLQARVTSLRRDAQGVFEAEAGGQRLRARTVILCTGARDVAPEIEGLDEGLHAGRIRYCPICDGFETQHQNVAVLGREGHGLREALFVKGFGNEVTWLSMGTEWTMPPAELRQLQEAGVKVLDAAPRDIRCTSAQGVRVVLDDGTEAGFDTLYPALGLVHVSDLGADLGARVASNGQLEVDDHLQTSVPGLYVAGDVAHSLNQINVAAGQAAIAATAVHNTLA